MSGTSYIPRSLECKIPAIEPTSSQLPSQKGGYVATLEIDWICNTTFHTFTTIANKSFKVIIEHASCVNIVSS